MAKTIHVARWQPYQASANHTVEGDLRVYQNLYSPQLGNRRDILLYLPPSYRHGDWRYPVIYMHDGQNLFDEVTSYAGEWHVDATMERLSREGLAAIVVGIPNSGTRRAAEYSPFNDRQHGGGQGNLYLEFIINTVKPLVDRSFRTLPERQNTGMIGSSLGGLISLYGFFHFPDHFGFIGAMSPSLWFANRAIFAAVRQAPFVPGKIYLDIGSHEFAGSGDDKTMLKTRKKPYNGSVAQLRDILAAKGYRPGQTLLYIEQAEAGHNELAWANRLPVALRFLIGLTASDGPGPISDQR